MNTKYRRSVSMNPRTFLRLQGLARESDASMSATLAVLLRDEVWSRMAYDPTDEDVNAFKQRMDESR